MKPEFKEAVTPADLEAVKSVRLRVFVEEQGVPPEIEMDEHDSEALHVICLVGGRAGGTGRLVGMPDGMKLGRVAVLKEHRARGLGTGIVRWLLRRATEAVHTGVYANVQLGAVDFYKKLGFEATGPQFLEAGIEHVRMEWKHR
jgi:predicted GNAT family N-acyltransferase